MKTENSADKTLAKDSSLKAVFEIDQNGRKQKLMVRKDRVVIGTVESADIKLTGEKVAPVHAFIELKYGAKEQDCTARIVDLASPSGVTVNGKKVINESVKTGDLIQIGDAHLKSLISTSTRLPVLL